MMRTRLCRWSALVLILCGLGTPALAQQVERPLKAAFLYRFAQFVEWPPGTWEAPTQPFVLCVLGPDVFEGALDTIAGKAVRGQALTVKALSSPRQLGQCHMAFISRPDAETLQSALSQSRSHHVLTVSDQPGFAAAGGMIQFVSQDNRLQFEINHGAARAGGLQVSSKLLHLARRVYE